MMTDIEDEDDWATSDELADDDNDSNAVVAESALDRFVLLTICYHNLNWVHTLLRLIGVHVYYD